MRFEYLEALDYINRAIEIYDQQPAYYFHRGNIHQKLKQYDKAHENYDVATGLEPKNARYWHQKGLTFEYQKDH